MGEWITFVERASFVDDIFTMREVKLSYLRAQETQVDEQGTDDHRKMAMVEFCEALARVADMKDLTYGAIADESLTKPFADESETDEELEEQESQPWEYGPPGQGPLFERLVLVLEALLVLLDRRPGVSTRKASIKKELDAKDAAWRRGSVIQALDREATLHEDAMVGAFDD
jgi:hypothetical protein